MVRQGGLLRELEVRGRPVPCGPGKGVRGGLPVTVCARPAASWLLVPLPMAISAVAAASPPPPGSQALCLEKMKLLSDAERGRGDWF